MSSVRPNWEYGSIQCGPQHTDGANHRVAVGPFHLICRDHTLFSRESYGAASAR